MSSTIEAVVLKLLEQESSDEILELKKAILRRIASETEIVPPRVPAPQSITEIGGYINLLRKSARKDKNGDCDEQMLLQFLASTLGLPRPSYG